MASRFRPVPLAACALCVLSGPLRASTDGSPNDWSLNELGGSASDLRLLQSGTPGVLLASAPTGLLLIGWRRLHGQAMGDSSTTTDVGYGVSEVVRRGGRHEPADPLLRAASDRKHVLS